MSQLSSPSTDVRRSAPAADRVARALAALRRGRPVLVQDDADRENEADLIVAAELIDLPVMAQLIRDCSGIVCLCLDAEHVARLGLRRMVEHNQSRHGTPFTVSIEAREGISTGVSAADRVTTVRAAIAPDAGAANIVSPGHVFPLCAAPGGVLVRRGHTEASVDLMKLAGLQARRGAVRTDERRRQHGPRCAGERLRQAVRPGAAQRRRCGAGPHGDGRRGGHRLSLGQLPRASSSACSASQRSSSMCVSAATWARRRPSSA